MSIRPRYLLFYSKYKTKESHGEKQGIYDFFRIPSPAMFEPKPMQP